MFLLLTGFLRGFAFFRSFCSFPSMSPYPSVIPDFSFSVINSGKAKARHGKARFI